MKKRIIKIILVIIIIIIIVRIIEKEIIKVLLTSIKINQDLAKTKITEKDRDKIFIGEIDKKDNRMIKGKRKKKENKYKIIEIF